MCVFTLYGSQTLNAGLMDKQWVFLKNMRVFTFMQRLCESFQQGIVTLTAICNDKASRSDLFSTRVGNQRQHALKKWIFAACAIWLIKMS